MTENATQKTQAPEATTSAAADEAVHPTRIDVPEADLADLHDRLVRTQFADEAPDGYGVGADQVRSWVEHWRDRFDWRALEARLNALPQFTTTIEGQKIHFFHVRSGNPDAVGLVLTHGWPGSVLEFLDVVDPLVAAGYDVVLPSMPGYGFSGPTTEAGWDNERIARAWVELMRRLGYARYGAVGNDAGSMISPEVGRLDPEHVVGVHVTQLFSFPSGDPAELQDLSEEEQAGMERLQWFWQNMGAFNLLHSQAPQTLAHALADSPAGLLGWNGQLLMDVDDDFVVGNAAIYWLTGTAGSSIRLYRENQLAQAAGRTPSGPTTVPTALCASTSDFLSIRRFADRDHANIVRWNVYEAPGHYTPHQLPELWLRDVTEFFGSL